FSLVDVRLSFEALVRPHAKRSDRPFSSGKLALNRALRGDVAALERAASGLFERSRFASDPRFGPSAASRLFRHWVARSVFGRFDDLVWIAREGRRLRGFISCQKESGGRGSIGL